MPQSKTVLECSACGDTIKTNVLLPHSEVVWCGRPVCLANLFLGINPGKSQWVGFRTAGDFRLFFRERSIKSNEAPATRQSQRRFPWELIGRGLLIGFSVGMALGVGALACSRAIPASFVLGLLK